MAVTNLLDRLAEDYQGTHPVEYRAPLAKIGRKIGDKVYSLGGGAKGVSARDIIRNGRYNDGVYPFDVLEKQSPNDLDEFKKAFENVRAQREAWNTKYFKDDALGYNGDPLATPKEKLQNKKTYLTYEADKQNPRQNPMDLYGVFDWKDWKNAKDAAKKTGKKLGRVFAEQNKLEKNMYGNISKGIGPSTTPVPEGRYKYALGNQNHVYSDEPGAPESDIMNLNDLQSSGHPIRYGKGGKPFIDAFTWTQKDNIDNIKKIGYLAIEGPDTELFHAGAKGQWTAGKNNVPMPTNYVNHVNIGEIRPNGENFNEELLNTRIPLDVYNNMPVVHQGRRWGTIVDVIGARPGAPEAIIGEGDRRRLEKVATPPQYIYHIPEEKMNPEWVMRRKYGLSIPGWHPNKKELEGVDTFLSTIDPGMDFSKFKDKDKVKTAIRLAKEPDAARRYLGKANNPLSGENPLQTEARISHYEDVVNSNPSPYELAYAANVPPKQPRGAVGSGDVNNGGSWFESTDGSDFNRTKNFLMQRDVDHKPIKVLGKAGSQWVSFPNLDTRSNFDPLFKDNLTPGSLNNIAVQGNYSHIVPKGLDYDKFVEDYLDYIGAGNLKELSYKKSRTSTQKNPFDYDRDFTVHSKAKANLDELLDEKREMARNKVTGGSYSALSGMLLGLPDDRSKIKDFDKWYDSFASQFTFMPSKENAKKAVDDYYDELSRLPSNKELAKRAVENASFKYYGNPKNNEFRKLINEDYMKADSLDKVIGHTIGRRIGADRAKRGKKIF